MSIKALIFSWWRTMNTIIIFYALFTPWLSSCGGDGPPGPMQTGYEILRESPRLFEALPVFIIFFPFIGQFWVSPYYVVFIVILNASVLICFLLKWDPKYFRWLINLTHMTGFIIFSWLLIGGSGSPPYWGFRFAYTTLVSNILLGCAEWIADNVAKLQRLSKSFFSFLREFLIPNIL